MSWPELAKFEAAHTNNVDGVPLAYSPTRHISADIKEEMSVNTQAGKRG